MSTEEFLFRIAADTKELREELKKARAETGKFSDDLDKANEKGLTLNTSLSKVASGVAMVATGVAAATTAFIAYSTAQGRAIRETEIMAQAAGLSVEEFRKMSFIMGTVGLDGEKFGDIMKDTQERIGDFLATGGGPFQDFADVMGYTKDEAIALASEFETMSGQEVLQAMVTRMEEAGKSTQQMSFALEGMASDTTRLIPLLKDGGAQAAALGETFDKINVPLSEEENAQFRALADNVDLAQTSFVNFLNNAIAPFLPAINAAANALAEFFASAQTEVDLDRIVDDNELVKQVDTLTEINRLEASINEKLEQQKNARKLGRPGAVSEKLEAEYQAAAEAITAQRIAIEERNKAEQEAIDLESKKGTLKSNIGADSIDIKQNLIDELKDREDAKKTAIQLLKEERGERLKILAAMFQGEASLTASELKKKNELAKQIHQDYFYQVNQLAKTQNERRVEGMAAELSTLNDLLANKLTSQENYQARVNEMLGLDSDSDSTELEKLQQERSERLQILERSFDEEAELTHDQLQQKNEISKQIESDYIDSINELVQTQEEKRLEAAERELSGLAELFENKLISQEQYEEKRREIIGQYDPTSLDPEALEEKNQLELEQLREKLGEQLISYEDYYTQLADLQKKDTEEKKKQKDLENWWSESSVKKQIDLGTTLLTSLGNNSKKQHKIQQGLSAANAGMNTAEGVTKALSKQDYAGAAYIGLTGAAQIAAIWASTPDGGGSSSQSPAATPAETPAVTYNEQTTTVTDITEDVSSQAIFRIEFTDEVVDAVARKIDKAKSDGRV